MILELDPLNFQMNTVALAFSFWSLKCFSISKKNVTVSYVLPSTYNSLFWGQEGCKLRVYYSALYTSQQFPSTMYIMVFSTVMIYCQ